MHGLSIKSPAQQAIEARTGEPIEVTLRKLYLEERLTQDEIGARFDVSRDSVARWMRDFGIPTRYIGRGSRSAA